MKNSFCVLKMSFCTKTVTKEQQWYVSCVINPKLSNSVGCTCTHGTPPPPPDSSAAYFSCTNDRTDLLIGHVLCTFNMNWYKTKVLDSKSKNNSDWCVLILSCWRSLFIYPPHLRGPSQRATTAQHTTNFVLLHSTESMSYTQTSNISQYLFTCSHLWTSVVVGGQPSECVCWGEQTLNLTTRQVLHYTSVL